MRKLYTITLAAVLFVSVSAQAQENLIKGGSMETADAEHWKSTTLSSDSTSVTSFEFGFTNDAPTQGEGGALNIVVTNVAKGGSHLMFYQPVTLVGGKTYKLDFAIKALQPMMNSWFEVYAGTTEPANGADYGSGQKALGGFKSSNWAGQCADLFDGTLQADGCLEGSQGAFTVAGEGEQQLYIGFKAGIWEYNTSIEFVVDNVTLVEVGGGSSVENLQLASAKVYPNPVAEVLNIECSQAFDAVRVLNTLGQENLCVSTSNNQLNVSQLKAGVYIVELRSGNQVVAKSRFIKQ
jgi:hypothetical protein